MKMRGDLATQGPRADPRKPSGARTTSSTVVPCTFAELDSLGEATVGMVRVSRGIDHPVVRQLFPWRPARSYPLNPPLLEAAGAVPRRRFFRGAGLARWLCCGARRTVFGQLLRAHDCDAVIRPGEDEARVVRPPGHGQVYCPAAGADDESEVGHCRSSRRRRISLALSGMDARLALRVCPTIQPAALRTKRIGVSMRLHSSMKRGSFRASGEEEDAVRQPGNPIG